jgi:phage virion morphogenesis protein
MAGAGIEVRTDGFQAVLDALSRAAKPDMKRIADFAAGELHDISNTAFENEADPVTGAKWEPLKHPRPDGSVTTILRHHGMLHKTLTHEGHEDGRAVLGTNMIYGRIHQKGGKTGAHTITPKRKKALRFNGRFAKKVNHPGSAIPARPYMGVPEDFVRSVFDDPYIRRLLGLGETP